MDWCSWLSKTSLEHSLVHAYALTFAHNELVQDDIVYFNHEFLQSMGINIAKHRQEILKLAKKEKKSRSSRNHILGLIVAIKQAKKLLPERLNMWTCRQGSISNFAVAPLRNYSTRWKAAMLKRNTKLATAKQETPRVVHNEGMLKRLKGMQCFKT